MIHPFLQSFDKVQARIDLSNLCSCQLIDLAKSLDTIFGNQKEIALVQLYMESLLQGIIYTHDNVNYWSYLKAIGNRKVTMIYHGSYEVQFMMMLKIPEYCATYDQYKIEVGMDIFARQHFCAWAREYEEHFGLEAARRLMRGVAIDADIDRLKSEFPFLKGPLETTFGIKR
jgi:hypothetical protein